MIWVRIWRKHIGMIKILPDDGQFFVVNRTAPSLVDPRNILYKKEKKVLWI